MFLRITPLTCFAICSCFGQNPLNSFTFGGSGIDSAHGVVVDSSGNIYVAGTTTSFDLPVMNAGQPVNSGTQLIFSQDAGATWKPLGNPVPGATQTPPIAVDPTNAQIVYVGSPSASSVCKSTDGGAHFAQCVSLSSTDGGITSLVVDPKHPLTLYATAVMPTSTMAGDFFKSSDGGQTWVTSNNGLLLNGFADPISIDPFHSNVLYVWVGNGAYVSQDGAASWTRSSLPLPANTYVNGSIVFDPVTAGILYGPASVPSTDPTTGPTTKFQKSSDGGQSWKLVNAPFSTCCVVPDPKVAGVLYALTTTGSPAVNTLWKSTDGGVTWNSFMVPPGASGPLAIDPSNPLIMIAGAYRSADGGKTWTTTNASRQILPVFAPSATNTVYATAPTTSDAFLAKFLADGKTLVFLTYFGGGGNDSAQSIALDASGNIWIVGSTSSYDLPVTAGAFQSSLNGPTNGFIAKFTNDGKLAAATYLGGSSQDSVLGIAVNPQGNPWIIGNRTSSDFPFTGGSVTLGGPFATAFTGEFDSSAAHAPYLAPIDGLFDSNGKGIAIDSSGNVTLTGTTYDSNFPLTGGAYHAGNVPSDNAPEAFVLKLDPNAQTIYSTYVGGSKGVVTMPNLGQTIEGPLQHGVAVAIDSTGNTFVTGSTASADFPTTAGAYQRAVPSGCKYPAFIEGTLGPSLIVYLVDDTFVLKLSADGKTLLYSTLLGGSCYDRPTSVALDAAGNVYVAGETDSGDFPLVHAVAGAPAASSYSSFVSILNNAGSALIFSTYLLAGAMPSIAAGLGGSIVVAGDVGPGAQTPEFTGPFVTLPLTTDAYLAVLTLPSAAPAVNLSQVRNAFSLQPGPIAPGEIISLGLPGFVPAQTADIGLNVLAPMTTNLAGVQVLFDGRPAFVITVDFGRVVCIAPVEIAGQTSTAIQVIVNGAASNFLNTPVTQAALGLLTADESGSGLANARNSDGTLNSPRNPAAAGTAVTLYVTGLGLTNPPEMDGLIPSNSNIVPASAPLSFIGLLEISSTTFYALPGFVPGLFALDVVFPSDLSGQNQILLGSQIVSVYFKSVVCFSASAFSQFWRFFLLLRKAR